MAFVMVGKENIYYESAGCGDSILIFVHGAGGSSRRWYNQMANLTDFRVIALDLPGHGQSGGVLRTSIAALSDFIYAFADAMGMNKFVLAGHSMGGAITMEFALTYPTRLLGLVLIATGARLRVHPEVLAALANGEMPFEGAKHLYGSTVSEEVLQRAAQEIKQTAPRVYWADFYGCDQFDRTQDIEHIELPTLIIGGGEDAMTPVKYSQFLHTKLANSQLHIISGVGHMCMEEEPEQVNSAIRNFTSAFCQSHPCNRTP